MYQASGGINCRKEDLGPGRGVGSAEDSDLLYRILKLGYPIHYCPEIRNTHDHRRTDVSQTRNSYFRGKVAFPTKHLMRGDVVPSLLLLKNVLTLTGQAVTRLAVTNASSAEIRAAQSLVSKAAALAIA